MLNGGGIVSMEEQLKIFFMEKISIILPVYKAERFIEQCLESIVAQSYRDWELIVVDDGNPPHDVSGIICDRYAAGDERIKLIHKPNGGVSSARNKGLDEADGDWVTFVDADDVLPDDALARLIEVAGRTGVDIVDGSTEIIDTSGEVINVVSHSHEELIVDGVNQQKDLLGYRLPGCLLGNLYRRNVVGNRRFLNLATAEDLLFAVDVLYAAGRIARVSGITYRYRIVESSLSHNGNKGKRIKENIVFSEELYSRILRNPDDCLRMDYASNLSVNVWWRISMRGWFPRVEEVDVRHLTLCDEVMGCTSECLKLKGIALRMYLFVKFFNSNLKNLMKKAFLK